jgi:hypothetical protein
MESNGADVISKITRFIFDRLPLFLILLLGLIPLLWFKDGMTIAGGDNFFYLDPGSSFEHTFGAWMEKVNNGNPNTILPLAFPFMFFWYSLEYVGLQLINIQELWTILFFVLPGFTMYYLVSRIDASESRNANRLRGSTAAVLYMLNVYVMLDVLQPSFRPILAALPLMLYFWIRGLNQKTFSLRYPALIGLTSLIFASSSVNPTIFAPILVSFVFYYLFFLATVKYRIIDSLKFAMTTATLYILLNFWWISTSFVGMLEISPSLQKAVSGVNFMGSTRLFEALRLMGFWAFRVRFEEVGRPLIPYAYLYYAPPLLILTYLIPIIALSAILMKSRNKFVIFYSTLAVIGIFLSKGTNEPFGFVYKFLYENIPGFWIFREPFAKFTPVTLLSYSVLLGYSVEAICHRLRGWATLKRGRFLTSLSTLVLVVVVLIILVSAFPMITGKAIQDASWYGDSKFSLYVDVPEYWYEAGEWLEENDKDARILLLPGAGYGHCYKWKSGMCTGDPVARILLPNPIIRYINPPLTPTDVLADKLYSAVYPSSTIHIAPLLTLLNVKYVLQQNDLDWEYGNVINPYPPEKMRTFLADQPGIVFGRSFGRLDLYRVEEEYLLPRIYVPKEVVYAPGNLIIPEIIASPDLEVQSAIFAEGDNAKGLSDDLWGKEKDYIQTVNFTGGWKFIQDDGNVALYQTILPESFPEGLDTSLGMRELLKVYRDGVPLKERYGPQEPLLEVDEVTIGEIWPRRVAVSVPSGTEPTGRYWVEYLSGGSEFGLSSLRGDILQKVKKHRENFRPSIDFRKINPAKYEITVKNATAPYFIVFSENYHPQWKAYYGEVSWIETLLRDPLPEEKHLMVNGYANSWELDETGDYRLTLYFRPQSMFYLGLIVSALTFLGCIGYLGYDWRKVKN